MSPLYTRAGDDGTTGLLGRIRLPKYHPLMETLGVLDEASAALGLARVQSKDPQIGNLLKEVQRDLYTIMAEVAAAPEDAGQFQTMASQRVQWLESQVDTIVALAPIPTEFILPGDSLQGAALDLARTVVRRAERHVAKLLDTGEIENRVLLLYLNRLSSLCFALEVYENAQAGKPTSLAKEK
jgi:cob(I)alamin adenosyltransferase